MLLYGGGLSLDGEFEIPYDEDGTTPLWWLPGFSSSAGGSDSQGGPSPGVGTPWPFNGWTRSSSGLASTQWQRFPYVVSPAGLALYIDPNDERLNWIQDGYFPLPEVADAPLTAPLYNYFEDHEGLRLYFRGYQNVEMDCMRVLHFLQGDVDSIRLDVTEFGTVVHFFSEVGQPYDLEHSIDLIEWNPAFENVEGRDALESLDVTSVLSGPRNFFRVVINQILSAGS